MSKRFTLYASGTSLRSSWELVSLHVLRSADTIQTVRWHPGDRREGEQNMKRSYGLLRLRWVPLCTGITSGPQGVYNQFSLKSIFVYLFIAEVKRYRSTTHGGNVDLYLYFSDFAGCSFLFGFVLGLEQASYFVHKFVLRTLLCCKASASAGSSKHLLQVRSFVSDLADCAHPLT